MCVFAFHAALFYLSQFIQIRVWNTELIAEEINSELAYKQLLDEFNFYHFVVCTAISKAQVLSE